MTFIVGLKCSDGLVIAAEQLESDGVTKRYRQKIHSSTVGGEWGVIYGGSGPAYVVDKFCGKFKELIGEDSYDRAMVELRVEACLQFVRKQYSRPSDQIDVIVGLFGRPLLKDSNDKPFLGIPEFHLYKGSSGTACIAEQSDYCMAGMDCTLAGFFLDNARNPFMFVNEGTRLAFVVTSLMKKYADGCGGPIDCFAYRIGSSEWEPMLDSELKQLEVDFPITAIEDHISAYWCNHSKRATNKEMLLAEAQRRSVKPSNAQKLKGRRQPLV